MSLVLGIDVVDKAFVANLTERSVIPVRTRRHVHLTLMLTLSLSPQHALSFTRLLSQCVPTVSQLLGSKCTSDVVESLEFLCTAQEFGLPRAEEGIRKALALSVVRRRAGA